jgi:prepilin-type N-terminal cleavage/methylation domain-containing protein
MGRAGFTLIELMIVIAIAGILLAVGTIGFHDYIVKNGMESQTRMMAADLQRARTDALFRKKTRYVTITATSYSIYSSAKVTVPPLTTKSLKYPVIFSPANLLFFDSRGVGNLDGGGNIITTPKVVCIDPNNANILTSLVIGATAIQTGKRTSGGTCTRGNINVQ